MVIIQISQIKHRRGLRSQLPFSLEEGELGLALDTGELFIGTPNFPPAIQRFNTTANPVFPFKNTQILTEWTDNIGQLLKYRYRNRKILFDEQKGEFLLNSLSDLSNPIVQYTNSSGNSINLVISRKLQEKLDDFVSVRDYGATGNFTFNLNESFNSGAVNFETAAIRKAILDTTNNANQVSSLGEYKPKNLFFPAGVYAVNNSLFIPPNSTWVGEGVKKTIITLVSTNNDPIITDNYNDTFLFTVDGNLSPYDYNNDSVIYSHSYQNIIEPLPHNIFIANITFIIKKNALLYNTNPFDMLRLINARNVIFYNCEFIGNWNLNETGSALPSYEIKATFNGSNYFSGNTGNNGDSVCIAIDSFLKIDEKYKPENINFINCYFSNFSYGCILTDNIKNVKFKDCVFNRMYRGISINEPLHIAGKGVFTQDNNGPCNIILQSNVFYNIKNEAIKVFNNSISEDRKNFNSENNFAFNIVSLFNRFENVGNGDTNNGEKIFSNFSAVPKYSVIDFGENTNNNISFMDSFSRNYSEESVNNTIGDFFPRVNFSANDRNVVINNFDFHYNNIRYTILSGTNTGVILKLKTSSFNTVNIQYSLNVSGTNNNRYGTIKIICDKNSNFINSSEEYTLNNNIINIELSAKLSANTVEFFFINNETENVHFYYNFDCWITK